ncbi:RNA binding protein fox-1 homolog 3-like [Salvelinus alpinus]
MVGAVYGPELYAVTGFPYPSTGAAVAYRGAHLRGGTGPSITHSAPRPHPHPCLPTERLFTRTSMVQRYTGVMQHTDTPQPAATAATAYSDSYGRVYATADPYHHTIGPAATYSVGTMASLYRGGCSRFTPY